MSIAQRSGAALVAAVGGAQMLKVVDLSPHGLAEKTNLRLTSKVTSEVNFSINDVEWCLKDATRNVLASGASNGNIILWDISSRDGRASQERVIAAHPRTVNRINWHPQEEGILLSAVRPHPSTPPHPTPPQSTYPHAQPPQSQDTTVKLWDRRGRLYNCQATFLPRSESVRDVQWNPSQAHYFAAACENGSVHLWDRRKAAGPVLKIMGHNGLVLALEWHLTEPWMLATGARDRTVKVWDVSDQAARRPSENLKETYLINTVSAVNRIKWRPGHPEQLTTTSSVQGDNMIHLWNVRHPFLPLATLDGHDDVCGSITWLDTPCLPEHAPHPHSPPNAGGAGGLPSSSQAPVMPPALPVQQQQHQQQHRSTSSRLFGSWGASWDESFSRGAGDEVEKNGLGRYTDYLGIWQHLVSCGRDGRVIFHSLARASRPRDTVTPSLVALSVRGEMLTAYERIDRSKYFVGVVQNDYTRQAPGIYAEAAGEEEEGGQEEEHEGGVLSRRGSRDSVGPPGSLSTSPHPQYQHLMHPSSSHSAAMTSDQAQQQALARSSMHRPASAPSPYSTDAPRLGATSTGLLEQGSEAGAVASDKTEVGSSPFWLPRFLYRLAWDETSLSSTATADIIHQLGVAGADTEKTLSSSSSCMGGGNFADQVAYLARGYVLRPRGCPLPLVRLGDCHRAREDLCQHNAEIARAGGQGRMAHVWEVLGVFLPGQVDGDVKEEEEEEEEKDSKQFDFATGRGPRVNGSRTPQQQHGRKPSSALASSSSWCLQLLRRELLSSVVEELLEEGDVQNCVALFEVVSSTGGGMVGETLADLVDLPSERVRECYVGYLEILHRLEQWEAANELVGQVEDKYIQQLYATNTNTYAACTACRRPIGPGAVEASESTSGASSSPWCGKCRALVSQCALCLQPVRGVYVWCPGCGHGGHAAHLQEWFAGNKECPTGCGHRCHLAGGEGGGGGKQLRTV